MYLVFDKFQTVKIVKTYFLEIDYKKGTHLLKNNAIYK